MDLGILAVSEGAEKKFKNLTAETRSSQRTQRITFLKISVFEE
jgi:hypothetical protein